MNSVTKKHSQIMANFDDIPISKIQKMPGYQTGKELANKLDDNEVNPMGNGNQVATGNDEDDEP